MSSSVSKEDQAVFCKNCRNSKVGCYYSDQCPIPVKGSKYTVSKDTKVPYVRWISTADRLPEKAGRYLITWSMCKKLRSKSGRHVEIAYFTKDLSRKIADGSYLEQGWYQTYIHPQTGNPLLVRKKNVIAWAYLEPFRGE